MIARELAEILMRHPEYPVQMELRETIDDIARVETDCFELDEGIVFLLVPEADDEA